MTMEGLKQRTYPLTEQMDGREITFRHMTQQDGAAVRGFAQSLPTEELVFTRVDISSESGVKEWIDNLKRDKTRSIIAQEDGRMVGYASLHYDRMLWTRHQGEIRVMVSPDVRAVGVGRHLVSDVLLLARELGLQRAVAQIAVDQPRVRAMFEDMGFQAEALLTDWIMDRNDRTHDVLIMTMDTTPQD